MMERIAAAVFCGTILAIYIGARAWQVHRQAAQEGGPILGKILGFAGIAFIMGAVIGATVHFYLTARKKEKQARIERENSAEPSSPESISTSLPFQDPTRRGDP
jgi:prolipoprotein diacylglyceryltransferase